MRFSRLKKLPILLLQTSRWTHQQTSVGTKWGMGAAQRRLLSKNVETDSSKDLSISEENKERAMRYLRDHFPSDIETKLEEIDAASLITDQVKGEDGDTASLMGLGASGKPDAKAEAAKRISKYMPTVTGTVPTMDTFQKLLENEHGALDVAILDVRQKASFADWMIVATGLSTTHVVSIADGIQKDMYAAGVRVAGGQVTLCGRDDGDWVAVDVGNVVVHVMTEDARKHYQIEAIWAGDVDALEEEDADLPSSEIVTSEGAKPNSNQPNL